MARERFYTLKEAVKRISGENSRRGQEILHLLVREGALPAFRYGGEMRFKRRGVLSCVARGIDKDILERVDRAIDSAYTFNEAAERLSLGDPARGEKILYCLMQEKRISPFRQKVVTKFLRGDIGHYVANGIPQDILDKVDGEALPARLEE